MAALTSPQANALQQLLLGYNWTQIAINLDLSYDTVMDHRKNIRKKLGGAASSEDMARYVIDLLPPDERREWRVRARQLMQIVATVEHGLDYMQAISLGNIKEAQIAATIGIAKSKVPRVARAVASALGFRTHFTTLAVLAYAAYGPRLVRKQPSPPLKLAPRMRHLLWIWLTEDQFKELEYLVLNGSTWEETAVALGASPRTVANHFNRMFEILGASSSVELIMCFIDGLPPKERREWRARARLLIRLAREVPHGPRLLEVLSTEAALQTHTITAAMNRHKITVSTIQKEVATAIGIPSRRERLVAIAYAAYGPPVHA